MNTKITKLLVPAALIVAGIVVNSFFDPFGGLLVHKKKTLQQTPVMIESIRSIGQLITAEYAGEVVSTLQQEELDSIRFFSHQGTKTMPTRDALTTQSFVRRSSAGAAPRKDALEKFKKTRAFKKRQLIAVGRGRVRAGIDFSKFTEKNFRYLAEKKRIYLYGLTPEILYCDINPWFIPEKKIKGFEIIAATRKANNAGDLVLVKSGCLRRLREQAMKNGIVDLAKVNAEETLREWFSILMDARIEKVVIAARQ